MRGKEDKGSGEKEVGEREGGGGRTPLPQGQMPCGRGGSPHQACYTPEASFLHPGGWGQCGAVPASAVLVTTGTNAAAGFQI